jgi:iron(III) transport system substrate-binding protein
MMFRKLLISAVIAAVSVPAHANEVVNVYSGRKEALIKPLLDRFTEQTGIETRLVTAKADKLLVRLQNEGRNTPADLFITADAGRLHRARQAGVLQAVDSERLRRAVPEHLRDPDGQWYGLSKRARVIFYARDRVRPEELSTYEDLADPKWKQRICIRSSGNIYNQSLVASLIIANGEDATLEWARGLVRNLARPPQGGDRDQIKAAAAGVCDLAVANTYYYGKMLTSKKDPAQREAARKVGLFWPNQQDRGAHVNVSGAGVTRYAKNRDNAIRLLEFLVSPEAQKWYAEVNFEYPVVAGVPVSEQLERWGEFRADRVNLDKLGALNPQAVRIMDRAGWR